MPYYKRFQVGDLVIIKHLQAGVNGMGTEYLSDFNSSVVVSNTLDWARINTLSAEAKAAIGQIAEIIDHRSWGDRPYVLKYGDHYFTARARDIEKIFGV
jgi:hypothetical protein